MKNILLFLSLYLMFLLGAKGIDVSAPSEEGTGVVNVLQAEASEGSILPWVADLPDKGEAYVESMAVQYRVLGRGQRSFSVQQMFFGKSSAYRAAMKRLEMLFQNVKSVYSSLPYPSWTVSSDHYIFGMRRILI
jgi:hypothetical protein